ncbi:MULTISPECIES: porin family protein [Vibrio]|uniref:porin family protein n=1 Tax=Vibrio TaxID=662 RepID=UPI003D0FE5B9
MKIKCAMGVLLTATTLSLPAIADDGFYLGSMFSTVQVASDAVKLPGFNVSNFGLQAGYSFTEHFALEGRYLYALNRTGSLPQHQSQVYAKASYPLNDTFSIYALAGINITNQDSASSKTKSYFSGGAGVSYTFTDKIKGSLEYVSLAQNKIYKGNAVNVGLSYYF